MSLSLSTASTATVTAVSKPKQNSVPPTSLSMVFGTPTIGKPSSLYSFPATPKVSSPPIAIKASRPSSRKEAFAFSTPPGILYGFVRDDSKTVPPRQRISSTYALSIGLSIFSSNPFHPCPRPITSYPSFRSLMDAPLIAGLSPGQSPPPVRIPTRFAINTLLLPSILCLMLLMTSLNINPLDNS